jgi:AMME syndrome candidate gene 1 protein
MATIEHCLYCFEALSANLEHRSPMTLQQVEASWAAYRKDLEQVVEEDEEIADASPQTSKLGGSLRNPALQRLSARSASGSSTPSTSSSSSLEPSTAATTPDVSTHSLAAADPDDEFPLFVTWNTIRPGSLSSSLRGCIGTFEAQPLSEGLSSYAITSAIHDHRFSPISLAEVPTLEVAITLLTDFEAAADAMDWTLGVHGVRISFHAKGRRYGACYLPDVAVEQGWDKEETIVSLMRKAGWSGRREKWNEVADLNVVRFQGLAESLEYGEFRKWKGWVAVNDKK